MSEWKNVLWEDPEEGQVYDVWLDFKDKKEPIRICNCVYVDEIWNWPGYIDMSDTRLGFVTHFTPSPKPPED